MRLGQLARKLDISPGDIEDFLIKSNLTADGGTNARLSDDLVRKIVSGLAPLKMSEFSGNLEQDEPVAIGSNPNNEQSTESTSTLDEGMVTELPDLIKAPKVDLPGLKILGKIELPEPPKKPEKETQSLEPKFSSDTQRKPFRDSAREQRSWKNPLEEKRKRELREQERRRQEELRLKKEQRTMAYFKKQFKPKPSEKVHKKVKPETAVTFVAQHPPKTIFGKIWRWLTQADA